MHKKNELTKKVKTNKQEIRIVAIGASAGGLSAFESFFSGMASGEKTGMAFVLIQHLSPEYKSLLPEIINRYTDMNVHEIEDGMEVLADNVYIIPPNKDLAILHGKLQLLIPTIRKGFRLPINFFFNSLAEELGYQAIGVILSGTGSDGTLGLQDIKNAGGTTIVQEPETAEFNGMPVSAIESGIVDFVLPPEKMIGHLMNLNAGYTSEIKSIDNYDIMDKKNSIEKIFVILRFEMGHDFSLYKRSTIYRRIERRMDINQINTIKDYVIYLQNNKDEAKLLFKDMLISVTNFFRDTQAFEVINDTIIKKICTNIAPHQSIRVWVPGCATGEEAYSIAILFQEKIEELKKNIHIQIFATDIDSQALMVARAGTYSANIALNVSKEQLERFFTLNHDTNTYTIKKSIRDMLIFSEQNYIKDPPFSKIDIISCRNSLIYMTGELQKKVFPMFHYALNPGGFLILGTSESIGDFTNLFDEYDRKFKIYHKKDSEKTETSPSISDFLDLMKKPDISVQMSDKKLTVKEIAEQSLIKQYATVFVVVNEKKEILYVSGRTGKYLESVQGDFNGNIIKMAREGLEQKLTTALHKVINKGIESVSCNKLRVKTNGDFTLVNLKIKKLNASLFMVVFEDTVPDSVAGADDNEKNDFTYDKDYYKAMQEEMTTSNEELKSSNEEMQSVNEELQSTNEELETSKEEMQSLNEELSTVNNEMQVKMAELFQINNDMNNLMAATGVATIYVDLEIHIRKFTPPATKIVNLIKTDIGRPLKHIVTNILKYNTMIKDIQTVIDTLISKEIEMELQNNTWFLMRILPYRTTSNMIDGAVITFFEITEIKKAHQILINNEMLQQLAIVVRDAYDAIIVQSMTGEIIEWNPSAQRMYGWSKEEAITMNISDIIPEDLKKTELKIIEKLAHSTILETYRSKRISKKGEVLEVWLTSTALVDENNKIYAITTTERLFKE